MEPGKMRHRITIQSRTLTNTSGDVSEAWATFATVWAEVTALAGREYWNSQQETAEQTYQVRIRYLSGVKAEMRVTWNTKTLDIQSAADPTGRGEQLILVCMEAVQ